MGTSLEEIDDKLWNAFQEGNPSAFSKIYRAHVQDLFAYGLCFTFDKELVKDCMHDVFVKIFQHRSELELSGFKYYLLRAMRNELLNVFRDDKKNSSFCHDDGNLVVHSAEHDFIRKEHEENIQKEVHSMLGLLTSKQYEVLYLRYVEELSLTEIAEMMEMNYQSVQNIIQRSFRKIRKEYKKI